MAEYRLGSDKLILAVSDFGAEITQLFVKGHPHNWIWSADKPWVRRAPVLFPIVGKLKDNKFVHNNRVYSLSQHGFARDLVFDLEYSSLSELRFCLKSTERTLEVYPFEFSLSVSYVVEGVKVLARYGVKNLGQDVMYYNLGWHPGFVLPHLDVSQISVSSPNYFNGYQHLSNGLLDSSSRVDLRDKLIDIDTESFARDAWILTDCYQQEVCLSSEKGDAVSVKSSAPHWGIWSNDPTKFICIEPWWGHADLVDATGNLMDKKGIQSLLPGEEWQGCVELELHVSGIS